MTNKKQPGEEPLPEEKPSTERSAFGDEVVRTDAGVTRDDRR